MNVIPKNSAILIQVTFTDESSIKFARTNLKLKTVRLNVQVF